MIMRRLCMGFIRDLFSSLHIALPKAYWDREYYHVTKNSFFSVLFDKGKLGEYMTYRYLDKYEKNGARFLFNLYLPYDEGKKTAEIDVIMICEHGIIVIESKNFGGWILGNEKDKDWTQIFPAGKGKSHKERFYNPVLQNRVHIERLRDYLSAEIPIWSIIAFSDRCTLKKVTVFDHNTAVVYRSDVPAAVEKILSKADIGSITNERVEELYQTLYPFTQVTGKVKEEHIRSIKGLDVLSQHENEENTRQEVPDHKMQEEPKSRTCPWCGAKLVVRTAHRGSYTGNVFWGCSSYPRCRYIENITKETDQT